MTNAGSLRVRERLPRVQRRQAGEQLRVRAARGQPGDDRDQRGIERPASRQVRGRERARRGQNRAVACGAAEDVEHRRAEPLAIGRLARRHAPAQARGDRA